MKIIICPDSFKGSLTSTQAALAIKRGFKKVLPEEDYLLLPLADGGEGTVEVLLKTIGGRKIFRKVKDPLGRPIKASFSLLDKGKTAVIEMASASGLFLLKPQERNPLKTTTYGTGELIKASLDLGVKKIMVGLGGSATVDEGTGMAQALGIKFLDKEGDTLIPGRDRFSRLKKIDISNLDSRINSTEIIALSDVTNPLLGKNGAAYTYAPQKGATSKVVRVLEADLKRISEVIKKNLKLNIANLPGAGAAGGLGAGLAGFLGAQIERGIEVILNRVKFSQHLKGASLVITGEGKIDGQVKFGKTILGVAKRAKREGVPVIAFCGHLDKEAYHLHRYGLTSLFSIMPFPTSFQRAMSEARTFLENSSQEVAHFLKSFLKNG